MMTSFPGVRERCFVRLALPRLKAVQGHTDTHTHTLTLFSYLHRPSQYELMLLVQDDYDKQDSWWDIWLMLGFLLLLIAGRVS